MLSTKKVQFSYNSKTSFIFPDMCCASGEVLLVTGNSGVGKTTLLHLLGGLLQPTKGEITINNQNIAFLKPTQLDIFRGETIGLILQKSYFIESFSVIENLTLASWLSTKNKNLEKALELLELLGLSEHKNKKLSDLSVGQQQRVSIARALINNPKLILADEPTSSLDDENTAIVSNLLHDIAVRFKTALVIVTHDSRLKERFTNQIELQ